MNEKAKRIRVFFAIELPEHVRARVGEYIAELSAPPEGEAKAPNEEPRAKWAEPAKLHITLKFLGHIEPERVQDVSAAMASAALSVPAFELRVEGTGSFPARNEPRVLWIGIRDETGSLHRLQRHLEDQLVAKGFERDERPFHPHLTIARIGNPRGARSLAATHRERSFDSGPFSITGIVFMKSELRREGSRYTILESHKLGRPRLTTDP